MSASKTPGKHTYHSAKLSAGAYPAHPAAAMRKTARAIHDAVEGAVDPLGMAAPIVHAQLAWMAHPQELAERLTYLASDMWQLQCHSLCRAVGLPHSDPIQSHPDDQRFADPLWSESATWDLTKEWYLALTRNTQDMLYETPGLSKKEQRRAAFWWRKWLNLMAPTNFLWTNPVAMRKALETKGESLIRGFGNMMGDLQAGDVRMTDPEAFTVGKNLATTAGAVVFRNELLEIIHYAPRCEQVYAEPVVIVTPWINKFYVLDLTPDKSMVGYLLEQGLDVFITSWKNPDASMRDTCFDDYLLKGVHAAIETAQGYTGAPKVHAVGYCIGGTALSMYMAWANRHFEPADVPVRDFTLLATLVDFHNPGDIEVFIDEASVRYLISGMERKGYLDGKEMAASFRLLRSNSLIWHYVVHGWLYGDSPSAFDVLYWNMDTTRMPSAMHAWYLTELYLHNRLVEPDALELGGEKIDLGQISQPLYAVGAEDDHIAPWAEAFRINKHTTGSKRFVLSSSGHIFGIVNPPVTPSKRSYRAAEADRADEPSSWLAGTASCSGSWWEDWMAWLKPRCGERVKARPASKRGYAKLAAAPGTYVLER